MQILLSIKPEYSRKIFSGEKKYEFRRQRPKFPISTAIVYESSPTRSIVGSFSVRKIHSGPPERIWQKCKESSGIEESSYFAYCNGTKLIHAFEIDKIFRFEDPIDPAEIISDFKPPQNFSYMLGSLIFGMLQNKGSCTVKHIDSYRRLGSE
jgi:predicted transcriptional regulator